ncbi:PIN domain-like protein [Podospora didyma]|uniref:PIN domain-like protein n=1 Tax=Podospora didyma TaxID=330526 RepID=A0AAE0U7N7_9PEZI|nr:PIN domain-like protein [Podospora didyma]
MGILHFWDVIKEGEKTELAKWSAKHFEQLGRPLRIAVDAAIWQFRDVNDAKAKAIHPGMPGSHPVERAIMHRLFRLRKMNIEVVFVFDGPNRGVKRGAMAKNEPAQQIQLLKMLLQNLCVPTCDAPGEAEAQCARMQQLGLVDAGWSEDSDVFMFGCTQLVRFHYKEVKGEKKAARRTMLFGDSPTTTCSRIVNSTETGLSCLPSFQAATTTRLAF